MGISTSWNQLGAKINTLAGATTTKIPRDAVSRAAMIVKASVMAELGTTRLRGVGKRGAKIGVSFNIKGTVNPTALVRATGPFHLIEGDTRPHRIPRDRRRGRGRRSKPVVVSGRPYHHVNHPGTRGRQPWAKGVRRARPLTQAAFKRAVSDGIRAIF